MQGNTLSNVQQLNQSHIAKCFTSSSTVTHNL
uniref:Uncharacterized protein n=1 Tax=Anguilla anguilla TaxID=7936 RepID=A0A0E9WIP3_ANGAN